MFDPNLLRVSGCWGAGVCMNIWGYSTDQPRRKHYLELPALDIRHNHNHPPDGSLELSRSFRCVSWPEIGIYIVRVSTWTPSRGVVSHLLAVADLIF